MALMGDTSLAASGRGEAALEEHATIAQAIESQDPAAADQAIKAHLSHAFETRLHANARAE